MAENFLGAERSPFCRAEELSDAKHLPKEKVIRLIEDLALEFISSISKGEDPQLVLVSDADFVLVAHRYQWRRSNARRRISFEMLKDIYIWVRTKLLKGCLLEMLLVQKGLQRVSTPMNCYISPLSSYPFPSLASVGPDTETINGR